MIRVRYKILYTIAICLWGITATAQLPMLKTLPPYQCVELEANKIEYFGDSTKMRQFYAKLDSLALFGDTKINIVQIGGSHVQADMFSNRLRLNFAQMLPGFGASRGAIFPFRAAHTNNPQNYSISFEGEWRRSQNSRPPICDTIGIMGYSITTDEREASITFKLNSDNTEWRYNRLRLLAKMSNHNMVPLLVVGGDTITPLLEEGSDSYIYNLQAMCDSGKIIVGEWNREEMICGSDSMDIELSINEEDSIELGESELSENELMVCDNGLESGTIIAQEGEEEHNDKEEQEGEFTIMGILPENDYNGITHHALGVNGASLVSWLRCEKFEEQMRYIKPDLAIMAVGVNDANMSTGDFSKEVFKIRYRKLLQKIYSTNPNCAVIFVTNNDCIWRVGRRVKGANRNSAVVATAMKELAKEEGATVWNLYEIMGGLGSINRWRDAGLANRDRIHFLMPGYNLLGDLLFNAIINDWLYNKEINREINTENE